MEARDHVYVCIRECVCVHALGILGRSHGRRDAGGTELLALHSWEWEADGSLCRGRVLPSLFSVACSSVTPVKDSQGHFAAASWAGAAVQGCASQTFVSCP